jgi:hypothetical protein
MASELITKYYLHTLFIKELTMGRILAYNGWDPLEEIWLGDVWPEEFYDDLDPEVRDSFCQLTEWTKHDLNIMQNKLEELGVVVRRPVIDKNKKELYCDPSTNKLYKPPIVPRDNHCVIGDKLYFGLYHGQMAWYPVLDFYHKDDIVYCGNSNINQCTLKSSIMSANTVRVGKDLIFDNPHAKTKENLLDLYHNFVTDVLPHFEKDFRVHFTNNGGHADSCFATLHPGLLMSTKYFDEYDLYFPNWKKIELLSPTYSKQEVVNWNNARITNPMSKWHNDYKDRPAQFNSYLEKYCAEWIGNYKETYFEVNTVMIDEKNMLCMGTHDDLFNELERHGITCHVVPFRTRTFWDGGLHCITLDIRRKSVLKDYFPERGPAGLMYKSTNLKDSLDQEYQNYLKAKGL